MVQPQEASGTPTDGSRKNPVHQTPVVRTTDERKTEGVIPPANSSVVIRRPITRTVAQPSPAAQSGLQEKKVASQKNDSDVWGSPPGSCGNDHRKRP